MRAKSLHFRPTHCNPIPVACQAPLSMGFSSREYWSGFPCPSPGDLPNPGIEPSSLVSPALADGSFATSATWEAQSCQWVEAVRGHQRCVLVFHMLPLSSKYTLPLCQWACLLSPPPADRVALRQWKVPRGHCRGESLTVLALLVLFPPAAARLALFSRCQVPPGCSPLQHLPLPPVLS